MHKHGIVLVAMTILLFLNLSSLALAQTTYPKTIEKQIREELIRIDANINSSTELKVVKLTRVPHRNYYTALFKFRADSLSYLGEASFTKQSNTFKYDATSGLGYAVNNLSETPITVGKELYYMIYSENIGKQIKTIHVTSFNKKLEYLIHPGKGKYFVHYKKLPSGMREEDMYPVTVTCYDKDNKLIPSSKCVR